VTQHPPERLSADEFRRTAEILRRDGHVTDTFRFASIELLEPGKQQREQQLEHEALGVYEQLVTEVPDAGERRQAVIKQIMMPSE
jgi:Cu2+-containing amine oxidase